MSAVGTAIRKLFNDEGMPCPHDLLMPVVPCFDLLVAKIASELGFGFDAAFHAEERHQKQRKRANAGIATTMPMRVCSAIMVLGERPCKSHRMRTFGPP